MICPWLSAECLGIVMAVRLLSEPLGCSFLSKRRHDKLERSQAGIGNKVRSKANGGGGTPMSETDKLRLGVNIDHVATLRNARWQSARPGARAAIAAQAVRWHYRAFARRQTPHLMQILNGWRAKLTCH